MARGAPPPRSVPAYPGTSPAALRFVVVGYLVMPDHIYLPSSEAEQGTLSTVMQVLKQRFARQVVRAHAEGWPILLRALQGWASPEPPPVWQRRFYDFNVWSARKRVEKLLYMHRNPVRCGLVAEPEPLGMEQLSHMRARKRAG